MTPNLYTGNMPDGGQQQFALYGPCKKNKIRISWKVKDYPHHRDEINTYGAYWDTKKEAKRFADVAVSYMEDFETGHYNPIKRICKSLKRKLKTGKSIYNTRKV